MSPESHSASNNTKICNSFAYINAWLTVTFKVHTSSKHGENVNESGGGYNYTISTDDPDLQNKYFIDTQVRK